LIDAVRVKDTSPEHLKRWCDDLEKVLAEFNIKVENIYNIDESGSVTRKVVISD